MKARRVAVWAATTAVAAVLLAGCGSDSDDTADVVDSDEQNTASTTGDETTTTEEETTTTEEPTTTTTTTTAPAEPVSACSAVGAAEVEAVLGAGASAGEPVSVEGDGDGCVWRSASGADVMGAAALTTIPGAGESGDIFPLFGLDPAGYGTTGLSTSTSPDGPSVVVVYGFANTDPARDVSDAVGAVASAISG